MILTLSYVNPALVSTVESNLHLLIGNIFRNIQLSPRNPGLPCTFLHYASKIKQVYYDLS